MTWCLILTVTYALAPFCIADESTPGSNSTGCWRFAGNKAVSAIASVGLSQFQCAAPLHDIASGDALVQVKLKPKWFACVRQSMPQSWPVAQTVKAVASCLTTHRTNVPCCCMTSSFLHALLPADEHCDLGSGGCLQRSGH